VYFRADSIAGLQFAQNLLGFGEGKLPGNYQWSYQTSRQTLSHNENNRGSGKQHFSEHVSPFHRP
jgi:hypothetical protein